MSASPYLVSRQDEPLASPTAAELAERIARLSRADDDHGGPSGAMAPFGIALGALVWAATIATLHLVGKL